MLKHFRKYVHDNFNEEKVSKKIYLPYKLNINNPSNNELKRNENELKQIQVETLRIEITILIRHVRYQKNGNENVNSNSFNETAFTA